MDASSNGGRTRNSCARAAPTTIWSCAKWNPTAATVRKYCGSESPLSVVGRGLTRKVGAFFPENGPITALVLPLESKATRRPYDDDQSGHSDCFLLRWGANWQG